ncbi:MAG: hypothetical protein OEY14_00840 [Myxococcales bacterium]|nr:hypothetical protein [Myxococcales bacterium]
MGARSTPSGGGRRLVILALLLGLATPIRGARAHIGHVVQRAERYLKIDASPEEIRVVVSLTLGPAETLRVMGAADPNRDGELSQAEADAYMAQWGAGLAEELPIEVDGERLHPSWVEPYFDPIGSIRAAPGTVEMVAHLPIDGGEHVLRLRDGMQVETYERTDVFFAVRDGVELLRSGPGDAPDAAIERLAYGRRDLAEVLTMRIRVPGPAATRSTLYALAAIALLFAISVLALLRRRRGRSGAHLKNVD